MLVREIQARSVAIRNAERVLISDSIIANGTGSLVYITESRDVTLENNELRDVVGQAVDVRPQQVVGVLIRNNLVSECLEVAREKWERIQEAASYLDITIGTASPPSIPIS